MGYDINLVQVGSLLNMAFAYKAHNMSAYQPNTTVVGEKAIQTMQIKVDRIEDAGEFLYVNYHPINGDSFLCKCGATRVYKDGPKEFGVVGFEAVKALSDGNTYVNKTAEIMGATVEDMESPEEVRAREYYYKLWKCLKKAMADDKLACHCNDIVIHLGKSVESQFTYYDKGHDSWCDYFLAAGVKP